MAETAVDRYQWWRDALAGKFGPIHDDVVQFGFYRKRTHRAGPYVPVAIFEHEGKPVALVNGAEADPLYIWTYVCQHPITEAAYHTKMRGEPWPDEDVAMAQSLAPAPIGHNNGPQDDAEILAAQIEAAGSGVAEYAVISDDATAARAQSLRSRLLELSGAADRKREAEKKPHFEAGKAVDAKYQPLVKAAKAAADAIRAALSAHETRKAVVAAEEQRKADAARREQEAASVAKPDVPKPAPAPAEPASEPVTAIRGAYGRAASVKLVKVATVTNQDAAYGYLRNRTEMVDLIAKLAQRAIDAGYAVPGVEVSTERKVA